MNERPPLLFSPGPVPMSETSLQILGHKPLHHRSKAFKGSLLNAHKMLCKLLGSENSLAFTSSGSGALESSVVNLCNSNDHVLSLEGGKFGERWKEIFKPYSLKHSMVSFPWGSTPPLKELETKLKKESFSACFFQACETSTGTRYPIKEIISLIKEHQPDCLIVVDGITAVGAYSISIKDGIDVLITGSQKALSLPTGMSFIGLSDRALEKAKTSNLPKFYFDYLKELESLKKGTSRFSCSTQLWLCLEEELKAFSDIQKKYDHCLKLQSMVVEWSKKRNLKLFSKSPSPSLTAIECPQNISASSIKNKMLERGYFISGGQGDYKEKLFRIGHMGHISLEMMTEFLSELDQVLEELS